MFSSKPSSPLAFLLVLMATLLQITVSEETFTVTSTNYITPGCFQEGINTALAANPQGVSTGIPIVFVYGDEENADVQGNGSNNQGQSLVTSSTIQYAVSTDSTERSTVTSSTIQYAVSTDSTERSTVTSCSGNICSTSVTQKVVPHTYSTGAWVTYTTSKPEQSVSASKPEQNVSASKDITTENDYKTETVESSVKARITKTAKTTTTTIFEAKETPSTIYKGDTTYETLTMTKTDPLVTKSVVSKSLTKTIKTRASASAVTIKDAHVGSNSTKSFSEKKSSTSGFARASSGLPFKYSNDSSTSSSGNSTLAGTNLTSNGTSSNYTSSIMKHSNGTLSSSSSTPISNSSSHSSSPKESSNSNSGDLFKTISTDSPPSVFSKKELSLSIPDGIDNNGVPYETNKFYSNLFLGEQTDMIWSYPYGMFWKNKDYYGFGAQHSNASDRIFGSLDTNIKGADSYYFNPIGDAELIFSSPSFSNSSNHMLVSEMKSMSALVQLSPESTIGSDYIDIPVVQGMGFVTAIYNGGLVPLLNSLVGVKDLKQETSSVLDKKTLKYRANLFNDAEWLIYVTLPESSSDFNLTASTPYKIEGSSDIDGLVIQIAVAPEDSSSDGYYDQAAGMYATEAAVEGNVSGGNSAEYKFSYTTKGSSSSGNTMVFALPHHVESLTSSTKDCATGIKLTSSSKGDMYGYLTNELAMSEKLETDIQFLPWVQNMKGDLSYTTEQLNLLIKAANDELSVDINETVASMDSTYSSGKVLDKYAYILLVVSEIIDDEDATNSTLSDIKDAFESFIKNEQYYPLMYDTKFGGVTSTASQDGDTGADYGSAYYNDHHFHYGYFVHAAAVVGHIDKKQGGTWAEDNKDWVNALVRDVANPSDEDTHFPVSRMFDWFAGHSWASGLFASGDGNNEESSSEDYNFAYGMKLWGNVIGDDSMESRGDLMLAIMSRAMNKYFYYKSDNNVEPSQILDNKVSGILFDNKVSYTTYFGTPIEHPEYVHGIHMLPITPASSLIRTPSYVKEEWKDQVSTFIDDVDSGWTGILRLNEALFDASSAYKFFSSSDWSSTYLDNGQSRTWALAFSGGISNAT